MKDIVVISGKGGTGKTTISTSLFARIPGAIMADCDVDAPDTPILLRPREVRREDFIGARKPLIDAARCNGGGSCEGEAPCIRNCRFGALAMTKGDGLLVRNSRCEGCGVCAISCPVQAISLENAVVGSLAEGDTEYGPLVHARLRPGEENSGKLVSAVRRRARALAGETDASLVVSDGSPGIGCPVIASLSGASRAVVVTEPSLPALRDLERLKSLLDQFRIPATVVINKCDVAPDVCDQVDDYCRREHLPVGLRLPFEPQVVEAITRRVIPSVAMPEFFADHGFDAFTEELLHD